MNIVYHQRRMHLRGRLRITQSVILPVIAALVVACKSDDASGPTGPLVSVCHMQGSTGTIIDVFSSELASHKAHGDYVTRLDVDKLGASRDSIHFTRITDALATARGVRLAHGEGTSAACRITIAVATGIFRGSTDASVDSTMERFPLVMDVPALTLKGALNMQVDASGRPTGIGEGANATTILPVPALIVTNGGSQAGVSQEIFVVNAHPNGSRGDDAVIEGFIFQSGRAADATPVGGQGIFSMRVHGLAVRGNRFEGGFTESVDLRASTALVERNYLSGLGGACDICLAGPGDYVARDNRILGPGGIPGITVDVMTVLPVPDVVEQVTLPPAALTTASLINNEVKGHLFKPVGVGLRVDAVGIGAPNVLGTTKVTMTGNSLVGNTFGIIVHAAFPVVGTTLRGDVELTTNGNTISQSCQADFLVTLNRHQNGFGLSSPYPSTLHNSTYKLTLGTDVDWSKAWYANPAGFGNTLSVNGQVIPEGSRTAYDAARVCQ